MKKANFIKAIETCHGTVVSALLRRGIDADIAHDAVQEMFTSVLANQAYNNLDYEAIDGRVCMFFKSSARNVVKDIVNRQSRDNMTFVSIESETEKEREEKADVRDKERDEQECPFCFDGPLNQYKACGICGTIVGQGKNVRAHMSIDEADLASLPDLDMNIDVHNAIATLEPLEQKVIRQHTMGNDTLDGLADMYGMSRDTLWRTYVRAKKKLQIALLEYSV